MNQAEIAKIFIFIYLFIKLRPTITHKEKEKEKEEEAKKTKTNKKKTDSKTKQPCQVLAAPFVSRYFQDGGTSTSFVRRSFIHCFVAQGVF